MSTGTLKDEVKTMKQAVNDLVMANRILANEGILDALGHISLRNPQNPETFLQARSVSPLEVTGDDILEIDLNGRVVKGGAVRPYGERFIHAEILRARPDMNAVFHGHPPSILPFTVTGIPIVPVIHTGAFLYEGMPPVYDDYEPGDGMLIRTGKEGNRIARQLGQYRVQLLRGHGCNIVGENIKILVLSAIYLNLNAAVQLQALQLGGEVKPLSREEAREATTVAIFDSLPVERMWSYWTARVRRNMPDIDEALSA